MQFQKVISLIKERDVRLVNILCHHNADPDALYSAFALARLLKKFIYGIRIEIAAAQGISQLTKHLQNYLKVDFTLEPRIEEANIIIILDTNTLQQLDDWQDRIKRSDSPLIVVDHHARHPETERVASLIYADERASSTCEIVYGFYKEMGVKPDLDEAYAMFIGIAYDTRHFILANSNTFKTIAELVEIGVNAEEALGWLSLPMNTPERIARLKASQRMRLLEIGGWIIAFSNVSAYQASSARALVSLGAHVAIVAGEKRSARQISLRASPVFHKETKIHLGRDIAEPLGRILKGMGGGHSTSAGVNGFGDIETAFTQCEALLRKLLG